MAAILNSPSEFLIYNSPRCFRRSFKSIGLSVQEKKRKIEVQVGGHCYFGSVKEAKTTFHNGGHGRYLEFSIGIILTIFILQVTSMLPTKFQVSWRFASEEESKNRFSRWRL